MTMGLEAIASVVIIAIIAKAKEKAIENIVDSAFDKGKATIKTIYEYVKGKLQQSRTDFLLERAEDEPTETNVQVLEAEILGQMKNNDDFAEKLEELVKELNTELPEFQSILQDALIKGDLEIGKTIIKNEGIPQGKQTFGKGLKVGGNAKIGDMTIENKSN